MDNSTAVFVPPFYDITTGQKYLAELRVQRERLKRKIFCRRIKIKRQLDIIELETLESAIFSGEIRLGGMQRLEAALSSELAEQNEAIRERESRIAKLQNEIEIIGRRRRDTIRRLEAVRCNPGQ